MGILIKNTNSSIPLSLTALRLAGFWSPEDIAGSKRLVYSCYAFCSFMFLLGIYLIIQMVDLFMIWGDLPLMTGTAFVLFTNLAHATKILNIIVRRKKIQAIIEEADDVLKAERSNEGREIVISCNRETRVQQLFYYILTFITTLGWASSAEENQLPLRAWYPYDSKKSPAYELTYTHQVVAISIAAFLNVSKDTLVTTLIAQCRCRLRLVGLALRNLCNEEHFIGETSSSSRMSLKASSKTLVLTVDQEEQVRVRLNTCIKEHQRALLAATHLQSCFSEPTFAQFSVSLVIICVTAFQLVSQTSNLVRLCSMCTYLLNMTVQVFLYCYQGTQLSTESEEVAVAAYEFPWYTCSVRIRRSILILMRRCRRITKLTAGGFTTLSLASFMAIIKTSYSMFTLLQQVDERN